VIAALVAGTLFRAPEQRTAKSGRQFVAATVRAKEGDGSQFIRLVAFSETAQAELLRLEDGDAISAQGPLKAEIYAANDGTAKISLSIIADRVLPLRPPPKERKAKAAAPDSRTRQERLAGTWRDERDGPSDDIGF
jgi:single-stranded DNA-binding protein